MRVTVDVTCPGPLRPPAGSPLLVEVRDTSLADAPARVLAQVTGQVEGAAGALLAKVTLTVNTVPVGATVRAHVDVDGDGRVSKGDFVTTASHPLTADGEAHLVVPVRPV